METVKSSNHVKVGDDRAKEKVRMGNKYESREKYGHLVVTSLSLHGLHVFLRYFFEDFGVLALRRPSELKATVGADEAKREGSPGFQI